MTSQTGSTGSSAAIVVSWTPYDTSHGSGWIGWTAAGINRLVLPGLPMPTGRVTTPPTEVADLAGCLERYFAGTADSPLGTSMVDAASSTPFERDVYTVVANIPRGQRMTYADVAAQAGRPGAARAVGAAMAKNRFAPIIPCHRVVGSDGSVRGYAGGVEMKERLLAMEERSA